MSSSPSSYSRCVRDALFLPCLLLVGGGRSSNGGGGSRNPNVAFAFTAELALIVRCGELAKRLDSALSLLRVWWDASLENDVRSPFFEKKERERGANRRRRFESFPWELFLHIFFARQAQRALLRTSSFFSSEPPPTFKKQPKGAFSRSASLLPFAALSEVRETTAEAERASSSLSARLSSLRSELRAAAAAAAVYSSSHLSTSEELEEAVAEAIASAAAAAGNEFDGGKEPEKGGKYLENPSSSLSQRSPSGSVLWLCSIPSSRGERLRRKVRGL